MTVPLYTSPSRSGFAPQLSLSYDSGRGNSPFGFGWSLDLPSITRKTDKGLPQYRDAEESDTFILSGAEDLVPSLVKTESGWIRDTPPPRTVYGKQYRIHRYRPRVEGLFARIERWTNLSDTTDTFWRSISKDNITTWYGKTPESRVSDPADRSRIFSWLICESYDDKGNVVEYVYKLEDSQGVHLAQANERNRTDTARSANRYVKHVFYGNRTPYFPDLTAAGPVPLPTDWCFQLVFDFGEHDLAVPVPQDIGQPWNCRSDSFSTYRPTFEVRTYRLCRRVLMFHHFSDQPNVGLNCLVRSTDLNHSAAPPADPTQPFYSYLLSVTQTGYVRNNAGGYTSKSLPPVEFEYTTAEIDETVRDVDPESIKNLPYGLDGSDYRWVDLDGEGLSGILTEQGGSWFYKPNLSPVTQQTVDGELLTMPRFGPLQRVARQPSLASLRSGRQQLMDLSGDGQLDLVEYDSPTPGFYERTEDADWEPFKPFQSLPVLDWRNPNLKFIDLTGDGFPDLLISEDDGFTWYISLTTKGFGPGLSVPRALDEEKGPRLIFADSTESIFLADMSGDGLTDLIRIRNGEVCYWPNLGYGHFGAKIAMDGSPHFDPPDLFDGRRIRLADIDGSGTADIIYFGGGEVSLYFNQSGNSWGPERVLRHFPPVESVSSATALDLLGNGTACLVWSSPLPGNARRPMRYIDLMGGQKPHLLVRMRNNLGAETLTQYAPSTKFYVADKLAGTPWVTRLPFPVQVVEQVQTYDYVTRNLFVTRYAYHHGYFDGVEREFRGFGRVDQWDTEQFANLAGSTAFPQAVNLDSASHVPPVCTKTWFHTGAYFGETVISKHFAKEYYSEGDSTKATPGLSDVQLKAMQLDDTILPTTVLLPNGSRLPYNFSAEELREACRALRGSILRQEIYGFDNSDESPRPYSASERNYTIEVFQPQGDNRYAVFFAHPRESINFHYERKLFEVAGNSLVDPKNPPLGSKTAADPRVTHAFILAVDSFGNVLQSVAVGYGRRYLDPALTPEDQLKQSMLLTTYTDTTYTNLPALDDVYRIPLPAETSTYELIQLQDFVAALRKSKNVPPVADVTNLFRFDELQAAIQIASDNNHDIVYENLNPNGLNVDQPYRRLIGRARTLYRPDDMGAVAGDPKALLALGILESLALPGTSYRLAFTPGLISQVYQRAGTTLLPTPAGVLSSLGPGGGGYVDLDGDGHWWVPSGRVSYFPVPATPVQEKTQAIQHFYMPRRFEDLGNASSVDYDLHDLLVQKTADAVNNVVSAVNDYRVLAPALTTDPNGNQSAVSFDALGLVVATAVMGKPGENLGDLLTGFSADLSQPQIDAFYDADDPHTLAPPLLGNASTRIVYDVNRFFNSRLSVPDDPAQWVPTFAAIIARETHISDLAPGQQSKVQITFNYSDGFGRVIQKKIQAEQSPMVDNGPAVDPRWVGSGWTIFNNKGKPVRPYEPFFSQLAKGHQFEFGMVTGVSPILCYDPLGRVVATIHPNQTYEKVVFDPWRQAAWDVNDTVLQDDPTADADVGNFFKRLPAADYLPTWRVQRVGGALGTLEQDAATKASLHANTPTLPYVDALGRTFLTVADNGAAGKYRTRVELDIQNNQRSVTDSLGRKAMVYDYGVLGQRIHQSSMEAGERWMLDDAADKPIRAWDSRGHNLRTEYDALRRPVKLFVLGTDPTNSDTRTTAGEVLFEMIDHGEGKPNDQALNLRTHIFQHFDAAGVVKNMVTDLVTRKDVAFDFKGNLLGSSSQFLQDHTALPDWSKPMPAFLVDIFIRATQYDALNRVIAARTPDGSVVTPTYNEANLLESVNVNLHGAPAATSFVANIDYNARGQRVLIKYGDPGAPCALATYTYDPLTFRLAHLTTMRPGFPGAQQLAQDLSYTYDPAGNITHIQDGAQQTIYFNNRIVEPSNDYTYDAIYRLIQASGREQLGLSGGNASSPSPSSYNDVPRIHLPHPGDGNAMGTYTEKYQYDPTGNFASLIHRGANPASPGWTRSYSYNEPSQLEPGKVSNRLTLTTVSGNVSLNEPYAHDLHGNMIAMPQLQAMQWGFKDQLLMTRRQAVNASDADGSLHQGERTFYIYNALGQRVRKTTESSAGVKTKERLYLGALEVYREYNGAGKATLERQTLRIMDDKRPIALVETKTGDASSAIRFQFDNHLGTACLELNETGAVISYEEYYPYGSTSYQAGRTAAEISLKRYRYTGKERDDETGLTYHAARYYAPWLGRWTAADPLGVKAGVNLYMYVRDNPIRSIDPSGTEDTPPEKKEPGFFATVGLVASLGFTMAAGQTPEHFGRGVVDKAKSITVDPAMRIFGPNGMLDKAAQKAVDKLMGIDKPDDAYVTKEEHEQQLRDIATIGGALFPGGGEAGAVGAGPAMATPNGVVVQAPAGATGVAAGVRAGAVLSTGGGGKKADAPKPKEPGEWTEDLTGGTNMSEEQAKYQKQVTGSQPSKTYHVNGRSFDGYEPGAGGKPGTLVEAKHLGDEGRFAKAYENMNKGNYSDLQHLMDRAENILDQARAQVKAARGTGARIEWRVSGENATQALTKLFENDPALKGKIDVVHVPLKP